MPYSGVTTSDGQHKGEGYAFYLLRLIQQQLNFTYDIVLPEPQNLGIHESQNYTGVVKLLQDKVRHWFSLIFPSVRKVEFYARNALLSIQFEEHFFLRSL